MASPRATSRQRSPPLSARTRERAGEGRRRRSAAAELLRMACVWVWAPAPPSPICCPRSPRAGCSGLRCVATSPATERRPRELGLAVVALDELGELDIAIDGADQIDPQGWLVKGGGGSPHAGEDRRRGGEDLRGHRLVREGSREPAAARCRWSCCASASQSTLRRSLRRVPARRRRASPDGGLIADYLGPVETRASSRPASTEHRVWSSTACSRPRS